MPGVKNPALVKLLLEEMLPNCVVEGLADYTDPEELEKAPSLAEPMFCAPPQRFVEQVTSADWIFLDALVEDEKKEKAEEQKLISSGTDSQAENVGDGNESEETKTETSKNR